MQDKHKELDENGLVIRVNKEEKKREMSEAKVFAKDLLGLPTAKYDDLPIDADLYKALIEGKRLSNNALQRHFSYIARLIHSQGMDEIQAVFNKLNHPYRNDSTKIKQIENYRNRLIEGEKTVINDIDGKFLNFDIQYVRQLARNASKEMTKRDNANIKAEKEGQKLDNKPTKNEKILYQYLFKLELR